MSFNHISQELQETTWWHSQCCPPQKLAAHHHHQACLANYPCHSAAAAHSLHFNLNRGGDDDELSEVDEQVVDYNIREQEVPDLEKELLFEKPLTPSDVGKLNRLVIPKQHAEQNFPLGGESGDKGLLLSFEDESGKCWRFRYSYWSSSQSYVLTKGWSGYVKEKRLDAGDVVLFERHGLDMGRLFIGWRRRGEEGSVAPQPRRWNRTTATSTGEGGFYPSYPSQPGYGGPSTVTDCTYPGSAFQNQAAVTTGHSKTLRLFGVNLECHPHESDPSTPDGSSLSSLGLSHQAVYSQSPSHYYSPNYFHQMDITFTQDVNCQQIRNRRG